MIREIDVFNRPYWNVNWLRSADSARSPMVFNRPYWNVNVLPEGERRAQAGSLIVHIGM